jgi:hypothetical protein
MKKLALLSAALIGLLTSCTKETSPVNPNITPGSSTETSRKGASSGIKWNTGSVTGATIKFNGRMKNRNYTQSYPASTAVDLFAPIPLGFDSFPLPEGTWSDAQVTVTLPPTSSAPTMQLNGNFTSSTTSFPIVFEVNEPLDLKGNSWKNTTITSNALPSFTPADLEEYTEGISVNMVVNATFSGGAVVISSGSNSAIYNTIVTNMKNNN